MVQKTDWWREFANLIGQRRRDLGLTQEEVADRMHAYLGVPVTQSRVNRNEKHAKELNLTLVHGYVQVLKLPRAEVLRILAGIEADGEGGGGEEVTTFEQTVMGDPDLSDVAKAHLVNQYQLLRDATAFVRSAKNADRA